MHMSNGFEIGRRIIQKSSSPLLSSVQPGKVVLMPVVKRGKGPYLYDYDKNRYVDFFLSRGSLIFGHAHPGITSIMKSWLTRGYAAGYPTVSHGMLAHRAQACLSPHENPRDSSGNWLFFNSSPDAVGTFLEILRLAGKKGAYIFDDTGNRPPPLWRSDLAFVRMEDADMHFLKTIDCLIFRCSRQLYGNAAVNLLKKAKRLKKIVATDETEFATFIHISALNGFRNIDVRIFGEWIGGGLDFGAVRMGKDAVLDLPEALEEITVKHSSRLFPPLYKIKAGIRFFRLLESAGGIVELKSRYGRFSSMLDPVFFETVNGLAYISAKNGLQEQLPALRTRMLRHGILLPFVSTDPLFISFAHSEELLKKSSTAINALVRSFFG